MVVSCLKKIDKVMHKVETVTIGLFATAALFLGVMQVVLRYLFNTGFEWSESVFIILTVAAMLAAGSLGVREKAHVCVDIIPELVNDRTKKILFVLSNLSALALVSYFLYSGILYVLFAKMMGSVSPDTGFKDWVVYSILPISMAGFFLRYVITLLLALVDKKEPQEHDLKEKDAEEARS